MTDEFAKKRDNLKVYSYFLFPVPLGNHMFEVQLICSIRFRKKRYPLQIIISGIQILTGHGSLGLNYFNFQVLWLFDILVTVLQTSK